MPILDPGWEKFGSGMEKVRSRIRFILNMPDLDPDLQPCFNAFVYIENKRLPVSNFNNFTFLIRICEYVYNYPCSSMWTAFFIKQNPIGAATNQSMIKKIVYQEHFRDIMPNKSVGYFKFLCTLFLTLHHLPPLRLHCVGRLWDWKQTVATLALEVRRSNHSATVHLIDGSINPDFVI